ncbi:MAG: 3-dehydroquinate synthase II [Methanocorpusculum sp.]|nr:3-dehydroquinate synthase II [Methanocorpusculum sp.]
MTIYPKIIIRADAPKSYDERKQTVEAALEAGYNTIIIRAEDEALKHLGRYTALVKKGDELFSGETKEGVLLKLSGSADMDKAYAVKLPLLIVEPSDWKIIPLENLISRFQNTETKIYACVKTLTEAELALKTMEVGCSGVVIDAGAAELSEFSKLADEDFPEIKLDEAEVIKITPLTLGDRVCIDTCSLMDEGDGMLIGSQSSGLFLVCSESFKSEYVNARPFRVNAGAVHSYIMCPNGTTKYLSEISAGSEILVRNSDGSLRSVSTGRVKIEVRPMLLIEAESGGKKYSVVLQNAETIRLKTPNGAKSVSDLSVGDKVFIRLEAGGRHFGHAMQESITEK